uniref:Uncharacterized protein n=1 Tax=Anguilla anguilla TaxID=7936 RepID=A0A0E9U0Y3_ANGAN
MCTRILFLSNFAHKFVYFTVT